MKYLITKNKTITCELCKRELSKLDNRHLKRVHDITFEDYRKQFPSSPTITVDQYNKDKEDNIKRQEAKKNKKQFVTKPCWNFKNCGNNVDNVNINVAKISVTCQECQDKNLFHPKYTKQKQHASQLAKKINKDSDIINKRTESLKNRTDEEKQKSTEKRAKTLEKLFGKDWKRVLGKMSKEAIIEKFGPDAYSIINNSRVQTMLKTYGVQNIMELEEYVKKVFDRRDQKAITKKTKETNNLIYGGDGPMSSPEVVEKANITRLNNQADKVVKHLTEFGYTMDDDYKGAKEKCTFKHKCGYKTYTHWNYIWNSIQGGCICPQCSPKESTTKLTQNQIVEFLKSFGIEVWVDNRTIIKPYELDIVLPEYKIAIEYNGLFHHNEKSIGNTRKKINDPKQYHLFKLEEANNAGYKLITIFEDEWIYKKDIVKNRLEHLIGIPTERIHARKCEVVEITNEAKNDFLNEFHIQGTVGCKIAYGAFYKDELVAVMTFGYGNISRGNRKEKGVWELSRFCTNYKYHIPGIASKLLSEFKKRYEWVRIFSFADRRWSDGNLYRVLGFELTKTNPPGYSYIDYQNIKRVHRFQLRKVGKEKDSDTPEWILRLHEGYKRIWDCGTLKFEM